MLGVAMLPAVALQVQTPAKPELAERLPSSLTFRKRDAAGAAALAEGSDHENSLRRPGVVVIRRPRRRSPFLWASLAALASAVALIMLHWLCKASPSRIGQASSARRKLSDSGESDGSEDEALSLVAEECVDLQEELGLLHAEPAPSYGQANLLSMLYHHAATYQPEGSPAPFASASESDASTSGAQRHASSSQQGVGDEARHAHHGSLQAPVHSATSMAASPGGDDAPGPTIAPLHPEAWLEQIPDILAQDGQQYQQQQVASGLESPSDDEQPSTSAAVSAAPSGAGAGPSGPPSGPQGIGSHAYVRLPVVEQGAIRRQFSMERAFSATYPHKRRDQVFGTFHRLFALPSLNAGHVEELMRAAEGVANYATKKMGSHKAYDMPSHAVAKLGRYFLMFDCLVCTLELLGDSMVPWEWWEEFTKLFDTEERFPPPTENTRQKVAFAMELSNRLSEALAIYKTGKRPPLQDIIEIKRMLFCSRFSPQPFQEPMWEPWRQDNETSS